MNSIRTLINNLEVYLILVRKIYNFPAIIAVIGVFFTIYYWPVPFIPDYFHFADIENIRQFMWGLFTINIGFSGLILTLLLLTYNFHFKSTRRNTSMYIVENPFLRVLFTGFISIILLQILGFSLVGSYNKVNEIAIIYFLLGITVAYILCQFPLAILSLKYSSSFSNVQKLLDSISKRDFNLLYQPNDAGIQIEEIEDNKIVILKDIAVNAISEGDWGMPQKILGGLYEIVLRCKRTEEKEALGSALYSFLFICEHLKRVAIKNSDTIITRVIFAYTMKIYNLLEVNQHFELRPHSIDRFFEGFCVSLGTQRDFDNIKEFIVRDYVRVVTDSLRQLNYSDEELPTAAFYRTLPITERKIEYTDKTKLWNYIVRDQINTLSKIICLAIKNKDEIVYDHFNWQIRNLYSNIMSMETLTQSQKISFFEESLYTVEGLAFFAIENNVYEDIDVIDEITIVEWIKKGWQSVYFRGLYFYANFLKKLAAINKLSTIYLDDYFMIARQVNGSDKIDNKTQEVIIELIISSGIKLYNDYNHSGVIKYELQNQINWAKQGILKNFQGLDEKFKPEIQKILKNFNPLDLP